MKLCLVCKIPILLKRSNNRSHYCGDDCRDIGNKEKNRIANAKRYAPKPKACDRCGLIVTEKRMSKHCRACLSVLKITECLDCGSEELIGKRVRCEPCREKKRIKANRLLPCQFCNELFKNKRRSSKTCYKADCQKQLKAKYNVTFTSPEKRLAKIVKYETLEERRTRYNKEKHQLREQIKIALEIDHIGGDDRLSLEECGKVLGVSKERARQIEDSALRKIKSPVTGRRLSRFRYD